MSAEPQPSRTLEEKLRIAAANIDQPGSRVLPSLLREAADRLEADARARKATEERSAKLENDVRLLRGSVEAQDEREQRAGEKCGEPWHLNGCDWPDAVADVILGLKADLASTRDAIARVRAIHGPYGIWDECDHQHQPGDPGVADIDDIGLTCNQLYVICRVCCTNGHINAAGEYLPEQQSEECVDRHDHGPRRPICSTITALDAAISEGSNHHLHPADQS